MEPSRVSGVLKAAPTIAYRKGEVYKRFREHEARGRTGLWLISSKGRVNSPDLNEHLDHLLEIVFRDRNGSRLAALRDLMRDDGLEADVSCFWHGERGARPPVIREDIRDRLARIPAEIEIDFDTD